MAKLTASERARLPDSSFAHIDERGRRRLPIHDEAHVRNALARFEQVSFANDAARERARRRLLNAAKKFGIVPVGFITAQLKVRARSTDVSLLPTGFVTFLLTDIEGSTPLLARLGDRYERLLNDVRTIIRRAVRAGNGQEVDAHADEFFAVFESARAGLEAAVALQRSLGRKAWPDGLECRVRAGLHSGRPTLTDSGYIGLSVHTAARVSAAAHGGQILTSSDTYEAVKGSPPAGVRFRALGKHRLQGIARPEALFQVEANGLLCDFPVPRTAGTNELEIE
jgi:class 3 adenylate cyclase